MGIKEAKQEVSLVESRIIPIVQEKSKKIAHSLKAPLVFCEAEEKLRELMELENLREGKIISWLHYYPGKKKETFARRILDFSAEQYLQPFLSSIDFKSEKWTQLLRQSTGVKQFHEFPYPERTSDKLETIRFGISLFWRPNDLPYDPLGHGKQIAIYVDPEVQEGGRTFPNLVAPNIFSGVYFEPGRINIGGVCLPSSRHYLAPLYLGDDSVYFEYMVDLRSKEKQREIDHIILKAYNEAPDSLDFMPTDENHKSWARAASYPFGPPGPDVVTRIMNIPPGGYE